MKRSPLYIVTKSRDKIHISEGNIKQLSISYVKQISVYVVYCMYV